MPISAKGNNWDRVCTCPPALTDQLDLVAVGNTPVSVNLVLILGPVMGNTLLNSCFVKEVTSDWTGKNAEAKCPEDDCCKCVFCFDHDGVV